jgi:trimeric autotransporter adhesin
VIGTSSYSSINGGQANEIIGDSQYRVRYGAIGGGASNRLYQAGWYSTIGGGSQNQILHEARFATIGGGVGNRISSSNAVGAAIGGGSGNYVGSQSGTIGGGRDNSVESAQATIGGGIGNSIFSGAYAATIGGGSSNLVMASPESLLGESYAMIPGGRDNTAADYCFAAGRRARATNTGAFVWADSSNLDFGSQATNEFAVRATGGVRLVTAIDGVGAPLAGATLAAGSGSWSSLSDRAAKENFAPANAREILDKVASLPLATWNYKAQDKSIRHIGPTAQDFHERFEIGENDRTITTIDADGVALAAIQGLKQKLEQREARICELEARLAALEKMIERRNPYER